MWSVTTLSSLLTSSILAIHAARPAAAAAAAWPNGPFGTSGRWITDASGVNVTYAGVNWPAAADVMIPEGLQYRSVEAIVSKIKSLGMNSIRLTYATEMVDQIYGGGGQDIPIRDAFTEAMGADGGAAVYDKVVANNPTFGEKTTRLEVFDAVAAECAKQEIYVHLDNHVSKAGWCCTPFDGNAWWGDTYFSVDNWLRGLSYMADHGKDWPNLMSMSLRNELRQPLNNETLLRESYNWQEWYSHMRRGADAINQANPDVLVFLSGMNSDTDLGPVVEGAALDPGAGTFSRDDFDGYGDKLVLELHIYDNLFSSSDSGDCNAVQEKLFDEGFKALTDSAANQLPILLTEFGFVQNQSLPQDAYASCLMDYLTDQNAGWMIWVLSGSYYIREGEADYDETWGLLTHDWSDWRSPEFVKDTLAPKAEATISELSKDPSSAGSGDSSNGSDSGESSGMRMLDGSGKGLLATVSSTGILAVSLFTLRRSY